MHQDGVEVNFYDVDFSWKWVKNLADVLVAYGLVLESDLVDDACYELVLDFDNFWVFEDGEFFEQVIQHRLYPFVRIAFEYLKPAD